MTGSNRVIDHTTFGELHWKRDSFAPTLFVLAPGFQKRASLFPEDFIEVLKDIHALQCVQNIPGYSCQTPIEMLRVDNHQASIGSRLVDLPKISPVMEACHLAAYLAACMLCCKVWRHSVIPVRDPSRASALLQGAHLDEIVGYIDIILTPVEKILCVKAPTSQPTTVR